MGQGDVSPCPKWDREKRPPVPFCMLFSYFYIHHRAELTPCSQGLPAGDAGVLHVAPDAEAVILSFRQFLYGCLQVLAAIHHYRLPGSGLSVQIGEVLSVMHLVAVGCVFFLGTLPLHFAPMKKAQKTIVLSYFTCETSKNQALNPVKHSIFCRSVSSIC